MLVVQYPELHSEFLAGIQYESDIAPPIVAAKFLVCAGFYTHRSNAAFVNSAELFYNEAVILVVQPQEWGNVIPTVPVYNFC